MEKNVIVVDEQGNTYGATYLKRARGLVKNGRARFVDENKICLACPPDKLEFETEDMKMSENNKNITTTETAETIQPSAEYTVEYILSQIAEIQSNTNYLSECLVELGKVRSECSQDIGAHAKAMVIADIVKCRETTNQQMLKFYEKMFDQLQKSEQMQMQWSTIDALASVANFKEDETPEVAQARSEIVDSIRQILRENFR